MVSLEPVPINQLQPLWKPVDFVPNPASSPDIIIPVRAIIIGRIITPLIILQLFNKSWRAFHAGLGGLKLAAAPFVGRSSAIPLCR